MKTLIEGSRRDGEGDTWRKILGARLGSLSVAILGLLRSSSIVADFRMLGEIDAAGAQTSVLGHDRSDAYQLLALTERLARDTGDGRARHARRDQRRAGADRPPLRGHPGSTRRAQRRRGGADGSRQPVNGGKLLARADRARARSARVRHDPETLSALNATVKRYVADDGRPSRRKSMRRRAATPTGSGPSSSASFSSWPSCAW